MNAYEMRKNLDLRNYNTAITREDFETIFTATKEKITFTFNGWDGKSYEGESRTSRVYRTDLPGYEDVRFIKVGKGLHYIDEDSMITEQSTGEKHPEVQWLVDILRREK